jgi:Tol biopolymer transport system component
VRELVAIALVTACSYGPPRVDPNAPSDGRDPDTSTVDVDAPVDGFVGPTPTACVAKWLAGTMNLSNPATVGGGPNIFTTQDERDPFVSFDGRVIYFTSINGGNNTDVLFATRAQASGPFGPAQIKAISDANRDDSKITLTEDDLTAFISTTRQGGGGGFDFWQASRTNGFDGVFDAPTQIHLAALDDAGDQLDPHISPDGLRLYYAAGNPQQIVVAERSAVTADFAAPTPIANIASNLGDADPTLTGDERVIIFSSNRNPAGSSDLFYATRAERDQPFGAPMPLSINGTAQDGDPHISLDGCTLFFASTRIGPDYDLMFSDVQ